MCKESYEKGKKEFKELELLKENLRSGLGNDDFNQVVYYLEEYKRFLEYHKAYNYLLGYWDSFSKEQKEQINKDLNEIFKLNKQEKVGIVSAY